MSVGGRRFGFPRSFYPCDELRGALLGAPAGTTSMGSVTGATTVAAAEPEVRRATAELLWEACHRRPDPLEVRKAISNGADLVHAIAVAAQ